MYKYTMEKAAYIEMYLNEDRHWWFVARRKIIEKILSCYFQVKGKEKYLKSVAEQAEILNCCRLTGNSMRLN